MYKYKIKSTYQTEGRENVKPMKSNESRTVNKLLHTSR